MNATAREFFQCRRSLSFIQRAHDLTRMPAAQQGKNKLPALRKNHRARRGIFFRRGGELGKGPALAPGEIAQGGFTAVFTGDLPPSVVKHCQFGNAQSGSPARIYA